MILYIAEERKEGRKEEVCLTLPLFNPSQAANTLQGDLTCLKPEQHFQSQRELRLQAKLFFQLSPS
jgi:hypothetical protein